MKPNQDMDLRASLKIIFGHEQPLFHKGLRVAAEKITEQREMPLKHSNF
jgi:hypothetical protein